MFPRMLACHRTLSWPCFQLAADTQLGAATADSPQADLTGTWRADAGGTTIELVMGEDSTFTWQANQPGEKAVVLKRPYAVTSDQWMLVDA